MSSQCHSDVFEHQEKDNNAALFLERNFKTDNPDMWLTHDMVSRCVSPDGTTVLEKCDDGFAPMPDFDLYAAGFPCTPWSRSECLFKVDGHVCIEDPAVLSSLAMPGSWLIETWWMVGQARSTRRFWWWKQQAFLHLNPDHQAEKAQSVSLGMCQDPKCDIPFKIWIYGSAWISQVSSVAHGHTASDDSGNDLDAMNQYMQTHLPDYVFTIMTDRSPMNFHFPMQRPRRGNTRLHGMFWLVQSLIDSLNREISELLPPSKSLQVLRDWLAEAHATEHVAVEGQAPANLWPNQPDNSTLPWLFDFPGIEVWGELGPAVPQLAWWHVLLNMEWHVAWHDMLHNGMLHGGTWWHVK